jgi:hypothetical protein
MTGAHFNEIRFVNTAHRFYRGASGVKPTPRWRIDRAWDFSLWDRMGSFILWIRYWHRSIANTYFVFQIDDSHK